jgi:ribosomal protein S12 methylthiotransferase accessory factor
MMAEQPAPSAKNDRVAGVHKAYRQGTHRTMAPDDTLARVCPLMPELGITRIANVTGLDRIGIPVVMVCRPNARSIAVSQGKGLNLAAAKASGLMEAVETYHAEHITLPLVLGSQTELCTAQPLVDVSELPFIVDSLFHPHVPMLWVEGKDLIQKTPIWLPYELVHANYTLPFPPGSGCFAASTNGLASGNHLLEAIVHGICEVVERDSTTLWNHKDRKARTATGLDLDSIDEPACRDVLERFAQADIDVKVWETTTDVGIASFYCLILDRRDQSAHTADGAGCHPARDIALLRALTEAAQIRMTYIAGSREDIPPGEYTRTAKERKLRDCRTLVDWHAPMRDFRRVPSFESEVFADDLAEALRRLRTAGIQQVVAVDLTKQEFQIPVVRVVIPGLEGPDEHTGYVRGARANANREAQA